MVIGSLVSFLLNLYYRILKLMNIFWLLILHALQFADEGKCKKNRKVHGAKWTWDNNFFFFLRKPECIHFKMPFSTVILLHYPLNLLLLQIIHVFGSNLELPVLCKLHNKIFPLTGVTLHFRQNHNIYIDLIAWPNWRAFGFC